MVALPINCFRREASGLTLIEVLVALAIVAIAMTAIIKAVSENIRSTSYLQNKTIAMYVGQQVLNEARVGMLKLQGEGERLHEKVTMLDNDWYWQADETSTGNARIKKLTVNVFSHDPDESDTPLISMEGYVYEKE